MIISNLYLSININKSIALKVFLYKAKFVTNLKTNLMVFNSSLHTLGEGNINQAPGAFYFFLEQLVWQMPAWTLNQDPFWHLKLYSLYRFTSMFNVYAWLAPWSQPSANRQNLNFTHCISILHYENGSSMIKSIS